MVKNLARLPPQKKKLIEKCFKKFLNEKNFLHGIILQYNPPPDDSFSVPISN